jgi:hypothetical protein
MPAMPEGVTHQHLLRAMDALMDHGQAVEAPWRARSVRWSTAIWRSSSTT